MFYKPRDVVSGDFPWIFAEENEVFVAAVDCTGHGVPGALISLIGYFLLNDIVKSRNVKDPGLILDLLNEGVMATLRQDAGSTNRDGMDIALLKIDKVSKKGYYSGAHRPLVYYKNGEVAQIKGDMFPVGGEHKNRTTFTTHELDLTIGDEFYLFSDGLPDQFGGPKNRKFSAKQIRQLISNHEPRDMVAIGDTIERTFDDWKGDFNQTDDVILIGLKF
jgi:serine phosphatase RsbU (regulator of sigma subunit)